MQCIIDDMLRNHGTCLTFLPIVFHLDYVIKKYTFHFIVNFKYFILLLNTSLQQLKMFITTQMNAI